MAVKLLAIAATVYAVGWAILLIDAIINGQPYTQLIGATTGWGFAAASQWQHVWRKTKWQ